MNGVSADQDRQIRVGHELHQTGMPFGSEIVAWGQVAALAFAWEIKVHWQDGDLVGIVEFVAADA